MSAPRQPARVRLLKAAGELFYEHGITATGVDAVIERAGVATGSLYKNFSGKDDLVTAYLADRDQRWRDVWESAIAAAHDPVERVLAIFVATDRWYRETGVVRGCAHVAAANQLPPHHPGLAVAADHKRHVIERLTTLIAATDAVDPARTAQDIALLYDAVMTLWRNCRAVLPLNVHVVRYEQVVADPEAELRRLAAFLGLEWDDRLLDHQATARGRGHVGTPSYAQITEPLYTRARGRWTRYREQLAPVLPILAPWCAAMGYEM